ncbi:putative Malate synthase [Vibrio nigripulchritudo MADA3029]|uniref:Putative Malate synthase n=1 Tax=Vibrio nigripulchritudo TaxID=28173 RepID=U4KB87_9VIBR|nr:MULTISPECIES: malate synthase [Vibrio]EGU51630.1 malate synthase [Vibrio nigripulchritudo ATCC 27043]KJY79846.1 hypothetical protein TW74_07990 [Vibrio nigripulchritudo]UAB71888.1 hypothetical protein INR79_08320 [Vibrio sp. SCSIO 43132]CCN36799.1 putative Malate synthase [Vibrio nigripulchritudo AM115]CCN44575.1 putative Malate synthase [Vibrio nigripulchritudo FTn2]
MTISTASNNQNIQTESQFDATSVLAAEKTNAQRVTEKQQRAKEILDASFPLESGSHKDVVNYMVYYCNLVACFADGKLVGLENPSQFVALSGHKREPETILLKDAQGCHLEISLGTHMGGIDNLANIKDIQLESRTSLCMETQSSHRYWISLLETGAKGDPIAHSVDKEYTSRSGDDYSLTRICKN